MIVLKLVLFTLLFTVHHCRLPDKVLCVNEQCDAPISKARTIMNYNSGDNDLMSFRGNAEALIYMKSAGSNPDLWYAKIDGKSGFVSSRFLRENKIYMKEQLLTLPVQIKKKEEVQPDKVQQAHEVVEGTTIYSTEPTINNNLPDSTTAPLNTVSNEEPTPPIANQEPVQTENIDNKNIFNQNENTQHVRDGIASTNTEEAGITTPQPDLQSILETTAEITKGPTDAPVQTKETISADEQPIVTSAESNFDELSNNVNIETGKTDLPPGPDSLYISEPLVSGEIVNAQVYDVKKGLDIAQQTSTKPEVTDNDNIEPNISYPVNNVETQPQTVLPNNVPNTSPSQPEQVPQHDNSLFGSVSNQEGDKVQNTNGEVQKLQETISAESLPNSQQTHAAETVPTLAEKLLLSTVISPPPDETGKESENLSSDNKLWSTESAPLPIESAPLPTESAPLPIESAPLPIESAPLPIESAPLPIESQPLPTKSAPLPTESLATSSENVPTSSESLPLPTESVSLPSDEIQQQQTNEYVPPLTLASTQEPSDIHTAAEQTLKQQSQDANSFKEPLMNDFYNSFSNSDNTGDSENVVDTYTTAEPDTISSDDSMGIISSMFSTVSNLWDSTTPAPPTENSETESNIAPPVAEQTEEGFSFVSYLFSTYNSVMGTQGTSRELFVSNGETCFTDEYCDGSGNTQQNNRLLTFLLTSASTVLLFTLGYYYLDNKKQDSKLIGNINSLQRDLLFATKECEILKEELTSAKHKLAKIEDNSFGMDDVVLSLKEEINELKAQNERLRHSLDDNEKLLRVSENTASELQNTLGEVENTLSELLGERANFEEQVAELNGKIQAFEEELISVTRDRDNFQLKYVSCETALEESKKHKKLVDELNEKLKEASNTINLQKHEILALKDALKELKNGLCPNIDVASLIDHTEIKAKLAKALEEKKSFESKYEVEHAERSRLTEELVNAQECLRTSTQQANEATTRLEVLEKYFQERESELMKELTSKESLYLSKKGESASTVEKIELLQQEIQRFKEKCDALTLELAEQESARRTAVGEMEARAHQAWLEARAARRDADAARDDAAALRRKLASITAADGASSPHRQVSSPLDTMDGPVVPPPLPPLAFLPPPLLPPLPRPPPLGRLPSPHPPRYNDRRYSPDSRYSPESRYSPGSRYSPETVRYSPRRRSPYSPRRRYSDGRGSRSRIVPDTETEYNSDSPSRERRRPPPRYSRHSGASSGSGCSSESDK